MNDPANWNVNLWDFAIETLIFIYQLEREEKRSNFRRDGVEISCMPVMQATMEDCARKREAFDVDKA